MASACAQLAVDRRSAVLDLAAGTGKLTRLLEPRVGRVVAVEPSEPMRSLLERSLPGVETLDGTAEAIPLPDASMDAVFVAEAFHWFELEAAAAEVTRILRPGGGLVALFNESRWGEEENPWLAEFRALTGPLRAAAGPWPSGKGEWQSALAATGLFGPQREERHENVQRLDPDGFVALVSSWSWIANLDEPERDGVLRRVRELVGPGDVTLRYETALYVMRKR